LGNEKIAVEVEFSYVFTGETVGAREKYHQTVIQWGLVFPMANLPMNKALR
jgi:hypothetical protein